MGFGQLLVQMKTGFISPWFVCAENKFTSIGPIYYEYGSMVITYEDANKAVRALYALRDAKHEDKPLLGKFVDKTLYFLLVAR